MFKILESNTIITQMKTFQRKLHNRGGPTKDEYHMMRPENAIAARVRGSPKIRRVHVSMPRFKTIFDTTGTPQYSVGQVYFTHYDSYIAWTHQTTSIKSLTSWASRLCCPYRLSSGISYIRELAPWSSIVWTPLFKGGGLDREKIATTWHLA